MSAIKCFRVLYFTARGKELCHRLFAGWEQGIIEEKPENIGTDEFIKESFEYHLPLVFIGATGIAVRKTSPFVKDKLQDSPVIVIDELGNFVIPILSGHYGGANELSLLLAERIGATAVITTATDINNVFSVDVFAKKNALYIHNKDKIKNVSSKILAGEHVKYFCGAEDVIFLEDRPDLLEKVTTDSSNCSGAIVIPENVDFCIGDFEQESIDERNNEVQTDDLPLILFPKRMVLGIGCKKGKSFEELRNFILKYYNPEELRRNLCAICSIDVKQKEPGLIKLSQYLGVEFFTFSAEELNRVSGEFKESDFVKETVGVGNVCERAAILGAGEGAKIVRHKISEDGMTLAEARRRIIKIKWQE